MKKSCRRYSLIFCLVTGAIADDGFAADARRVTFVCEHGVAKSVIAAAIFNREARARGIDVTAYARGVAPEAALQPATVTGLERDGLDASRFRPTQISPRDVSESELVVTIGVAEEPGFVKGPKMREWDAVPPVSEGYEAARDAITVEVLKLLEQLDAGAK